MSALLPRPSPALPLPPEPVGESDSSTGLRGLIWLYIFLLIFEGTLRKWIFPELSGPLLFIRDPVAIAIYVVAFAEGRFPWPPSCVLLFVLGVICTFNGAVVNITHPLVTVYGFKANFAHLPLIFVFSRALRLADVIAIGRFVLVIGILMLPVVIQQFRTGPDSWWNLGAGGHEGGQISGALGKVRASGFFSFVTGIVQFCSLQAAFVIYGLVQPRTFSRPLLYLSTAALGLTLALSISRSALGSVATVFLMVGLIVILNPRAAGRFGQAGAALAVIVFILSGLDLFSEGAEVMSARLSSTGDLEAGVAGTTLAWSARVLGDLVHGFHAMGTAPLLGHGIGLGTNVGAQLMEGRFSYLLAEGEWPRVILEMGPLFGFVYLATRIAILVSLFRSAAKATQQGNVLPLLLFGSSSWLLFNGQFGQVTTVGFAAVCAGLAFAAQNQLSPVQATALPVERKDLVRSRSNYAEFLYGNSRPKS